MRGRRGRPRHNADGRTAFGRTGGVVSHVVVGVDVVFALLGRDYLPSTSVARRLGTGATGVRFVP